MAISYTVLYGIYKYQWQCLQALSARSPRFLVRFHLRKPPFRASAVPHTQVIANEVVPGRTQCGPTTLNTSTLLCLLLICDVQLTDDLIIELSLWREWLYSPQGWRSLSPV
jgi:hypothetical protein